MSDALCGPSNALQNFQKHASVDRTLQQDRLISRQSSSQGFRSQNHSEGALDPEFAAFEANLAGAPHPDLHHGAPFPAHASQFTMPNPAESQGWAADFQNLQISGPARPMHQHSVMPAASPMMSQQGWHNEFMNQQQQRPHGHTPIQQHQPYAPGFQSSFAPNYSMHAAPMNAFPAAQEGIANHQPPAEAFDESAFEAAFEQARADMTSSQATDMAHETAAEEAVAETVHLEETPSTVPQETIRIGSDTIPQTDKENTSGRLNDADDLARTAGHLLESVRHDQSQKFRESNFLALMRRIRDREVQVEGDEFRETAQSLHPGGKYYPGGQPAKNEHPESIITTSHNSDSNPAVPDRSMSHPVAGDEALPSLQSSGAISGPGPGDDGSLYAGWNYGDRWA